MTSAPRHEEPSLPDAQVPLVHAPESLVVLTHDEELLETLRAVASGHQISTIGAEADLATHLLHEHAGVAVIDTAAVLGPIAKLTSNLRAQFPELVLIVAGGGEDQTALTAQITNGTVYRFLHKPVSEQRVKLFVNAAWRRHGQEHTGITGLAQTATVAALPMSWPRKPLWIVASCGGAVLAAGVLWLVMRQPGERPAAVRASAPAATSPTTSSTAGPAAAVIPREIELERLLGAAEQALLAEQTDEAAGLVDSARALEPDNLRVAFLTMQINKERERALPAAASSTPARGDTARPAAAETAGTSDAQRQLAGRIVAEARKALADGKAEEGERLIQLARDAGVSAELQEALVREAREVRIAVRADAMARLSQLFNDRLTQNRLVEPVNDSAKYYLAQLAESEAEHPSTQRAREALSKRLMDEARGYVARQDFAAARRWLSEARAVGADAAGIAAVERDIVTAQDAVQKVDEIVPESSLKRVRYIDPEYPDAARRDGATGWVDLVFTVQPSGSVEEVAVTRAEPAEVFDNAAIAAVRRWRYEPVERDGQKVARRVKVRIRFELK